MALKPPYEGNMEPITIIAVLGVASTLTMFAALVRQTVRAERHKAALLRVMTTIAECEAAANGALK